MLTNNMRPIYRKWFILGVLLVGLFVFGYSDYLENVRAMAPCYQECEERRSACYDNCTDECNSTDAPCASCVETCDSLYVSCMGAAVACPNDPPAESGQCETHFGTHCVLSGGNCVSYHNGYWLTCTNGGGPCVYCPPGEYCVSVPPC